LNITLRQIITQVVGVVLTLLLVRQRDDYVLYALATVVAMSGANLFNFFYSKKYIDLHLTLKINIVKYFRPLLMIFFYSIMVIIYASSDITMLGLLSDVSHVGIYSVASKIYGMAKNIFIAAMVPLIPRVAYYLGNNKTEEIKRLVQKTIDIMIFLVLPGLLLLILYSKNIILLLSGSEYIDAFRPLQLLSVALFFALGASIFTSAIMIPNRQEKEVTIITIISAGSNILLNLLLIPLIKENGAAITTVIAEAIVFIASGYYCKKYFELSEIGREILYTIFGCLGIIACYFIVGNIISNPIGQMFIGGLSGIIVYLCLMFFINRRLVEEIKRQYLKK
jgi:O-antigen/teichoic acid export membrane protein